MVLAPVLRAPAAAVGLAYALLGELLVTTAWADGPTGYQASCWTPLGGAR